MWASIICMINSIIFNNSFYKSVYINFGTEIITINEEIFSFETMDKLVGYVFNSTKCCTYKCATLIPQIIKGYFTPATPISNHPI